MNGAVVNVLLVIDTGIRADSKCANITKRLSACFTVKLIYLTMDTIRANTLIVNLITMVITVHCTTHTISLSFVEMLKRIY